MSDCPYPDKVPYRSERAAKAAMRSIVNHKRDGGEHIHAYRCGGHWHVGRGYKTRNVEMGRKFR